MIYLSVGITGKDREDYLSEFSYYEQLLSERTYYDEYKQRFEPIGVINPAKLCDGLPKLTENQYMDICNRLLCMCDTIYMLPNWQDSKGAKQELSWAIATHKVIEVAPTE